MLDRLKSLLPRKGNWTPLIPIHIRAVILALWAIEPITRGLDYITGDKPGVTQSLSAVEGAFPLQVWGAFCLTGGVLILTGFAGRWRRVAITGLHIAGATYCALAIGLTDTAIGRGGDGFRTPVMFFVFALTFWSAAIGYAVIRRDRLVVIEDDDPDAKALDGSPTPDHG
ncbi:minor tail protein [Gordonia phage Pleakley]|uniref:Uncharacterized protein n=1 Tax=Gordonia phage Pleakley TaxID=2283246 RepID=A0A345M6H6_9CAUD|nr:minor tail protein [Gordonia phage Pleakley]AXH49784.1 hypothetical protein SEA_FURY_58 [Gordonia phage Fury]AXH66097.1 hypothetical protein SEA_PLEAKLEY_58 [Gordonia phage Pleakley]